MTIRSLSRARAGAVLAAALLSATAAPATAGKPDHGERDARKAERKAERQAARRQVPPGRPAQSKPEQTVQGKSGKAKAGRSGKLKKGAAARQAPSPPVAAPAAGSPSAAPAPVPATTTPQSGGEQRSAPPKRRTRPKVRARGPRAAPAAAAIVAPVLARVAPGPAPEAEREAAAPVEREREQQESSSSPVPRTVRELVEVVPEAVKMLLAAMAVLSIVLGGGYLLTSARARRLARQRSDLLQEVGLLQTALLPPVPESVGAVRTSVAYRPSDGPGAGGDFYDALTLPGGRAAFILGDVSGHGRAALARTAFMRYTLRAYLEAGLDPRTTLQVAGRVIDDHLGGDFATVVLAVHDPRDGSLTYACAGHPAPIVVGTPPYGARPASGRPALLRHRHEPVLAASSPPIGLGMRTGLRQTTLPLPAGSVACLYTDGLAEARTEHGILGRPRLGDIVEDLGREATAQDLLARVAQEARLVTDDMATVVLTPTAGVTAGGFRSEQLEVDGDEAGGPLPRQFLNACAMRETAAVEEEVRQTARTHGGVVIHVEYGTKGPRASVLPRNVESLQAASQRARLAIG